MRLDEARSLHAATAARLTALVRDQQASEADLAQVAAQLRDLAHHEPSAATARRRSDLRAHKHAVEARVAAAKEAAETCRRDLRRIEEALSAYERRHAAPPPVARPAPPVAVPAGTESSALRPVIDSGLRPAVEARRPIVPQARLVEDDVPVARPAPVPLGNPIALPTPLPGPRSPLPTPLPRAWQEALLPAGDAGYGGKIGPYRIERLLGTGTQASVYLASDAIRQAALKLIDAAHVDQATWRAVRREARRLAAIRSDHVLCAYGFDEVDFQPDPTHAPFRLAYLALEYMEQGTLIHFEAEAGGRLGIPTCVEAVVQAATGLAAIHSAGVLHRDLKPHNIMVGLRDGAPIYRVGDLGIATESDLATHDLSGTLHYLAPEILSTHRDKSGPLPFSHASDLFGLGATLYRLLTGQTPIQALAAARGPRQEGQSVHAADLYREARTLPDPRTARPDCPKALAEAVLAATAFDPAQRPASAEDLAETLQAALTTRRRLFPW